MDKGPKSLVYRERGGDEALVCVHEVRVRNAHFVAVGGVAIEAAFRLDQLLVSNLIILYHHKFH